MAVGPSRHTHPDSGSASNRSGNSGCSRHRSISNFAGSPTTRFAVRVATSALYFFKREDSHISITGPWPSTVKKRRCSSLPMLSSSNSTAHIHRKRVRRLWSASATATRNDSFFEASFTIVKNLTSGCSILISVLASAIGVDGNLGADSNHEFRSLVQFATICSIRAGTAERLSRTLFCASSSRFSKCSPRPSARRALTWSSIRGTNF
mmetsp:Transcript_112688/g.313478  ORF Transcript_112688/g.313478 Transcript_112688/m.313478 type:complete len:208 (+) Transcript_112688:1642-2265(+)